LRTTANHIVAKVQVVMTGERLEALSIDEAVGGTRLSAVLRDLWPSGQMLYSYSKLTAKRSLGAWVRHLALCLRERPGVASVTRLVGRDGDEARSIRFRSLSPDAAHGLLAKLLGLYWIGQTAPLPFFPISAREYLTAIEKGADEARALERARERFRRGRSGEFAESDDLYVKLAFGGADALDPAFRPVSEGGEDIPSFGDLAVDILGELASHEEKE
jgi:exodeoxyribonuclease V gamma subunit